MHMPVCVCVWLEVNVKYFSLLLFTLFFEKGSLTKPGTQWFGHDLWLVSDWDIPVSTFQWWACVIMLGFFYIRPGDLNSVPHACIRSTLLTNCRIMNMNCQTWLFMWVLRIWTQFLMFAAYTLFTESSTPPCCASWRMHLFRYHHVFFFFFSCWWKC